MTNKKNDKLKAWLMKSIQESEAEGGMEIIEDVKSKYEQKVYESKVKNMHSNLLDLLENKCSSYSLDNENDRFSLVLALVEAGILEGPNIGEDENDE